MIQNRCVILIVDDDENDLILIGRAFQRADPKVLTKVARDGEEAIRYLSGDGAFADRDQYPLPCLILMDLKMPRKNGFDVLEWLRQQPGLRRLPVVIFSSSRQPEDINRAYDLGANTYLVKLVDFGALTELVKHVNAYWTGLAERPECLPQRRL